MLRIALHLLAVAALALLLRRFVCALVLVRGHSMRDTLSNGDVLLALRYGLFGQPKRFDIVICRFPGRKGLFIKRIIGLPGETLTMEDDAILVDGAPLEEPFPLHSSLRRLPERCLGPDEYFVMGDNRMASRDSRIVGPLSRSMLLGRAVFALLPLRRMRRLR